MKHNNQTLTNNLAAEDISGLVIIAQKERGRGKLAVETRAG